jgi:hypothetical protein
MAGARSPWLSPVILVVCNPDAANRRLPRRTYAVPAAIIEVFAAKFCPARDASRLGPVCRDAGLRSMTVADRSMRQ